MESSLPVRICQQRLTQFVQCTSKTHSLEIILRIFHKTIKFFSLLLQKGEAFLNKCSLQILKSIEMLGVIQGIHLIQEFVCPDDTGLYLFQRASLEKCLGRGFLFGYSFLSNLNLAEKLELLQLPKAARMAVGHCSLLRVATDVSYLFYRLFSLIEGIRKKKLAQAAIAISKIFTIISTLILTILNAQVPFLVLALTGISILTDTANLARMEQWI